MNLKETIQRCKKLILDEIQCYDHKIEWHQWNLKNVSGTSNENVKRIQKWSKEKNNLLESDKILDGVIDDEQLLEEYNKEIHKQYAKPGEMTVARLIESHRKLRQLNIERNEVFDEARKEGYDHGYERGMRNVEANTIQYEDLRKMTIQDLANLIGTDDE